MAKFSRFCAVAATGLVGVMIGFGAAEAQRQPHMEAALASLQNAQTQLQVAAENKAGHRKKALDFVAAAIAEVRAGIAAGAR